MPAVSIDRAEDDTVLEDHVDGEHVPVERHGSLAPVDAEQAGDAAAPQHAYGVRHQLRVACGLDDEVEAPELGERRVARRDVVRAGRLDQLVGGLE